MKKITTTFVLVLACLFLSAQDKIYVHVATAGNIDGHRTTINHPDLNGNPDAPIVFTQVWNINDIEGVYNDNPTGLDYWADGGRWIIFNENGAEMPIDAKFNVFIADDSEVYTHTADATNIYGPINQLTSLSSIPSINEFSFVFFSNLWDATTNIPNPHPYGTYWFDGVRGLYRQNGGAIPEGAMFKVMRSTGSSSNRISHVSEAANISFNWTVIDHPLLNGNPNATFVFAHYWGYDGGNQVDIPHYLGSWYTGTNWAIFIQDTSVAFPENALIDIVIANQEVLSTNDFESISVTVYPNPVINELSIQSQTVLTSIEIFNMLGQLVFEKELDTVSSQIDISKLAAGNYIAKINSVDGSVNKKIMKK